MGTYFVEIRPYPSLSADITEYLAILSVSRMVLIPRKQVAENQEFLLVTVKYYYITSVTKKEEGICPLPFSRITSSAFPVPAAGEPAPRSVPAEAPDAAVLSSL